MPVSIAPAIKCRERSKPVVRGLRPRRNAKPTNLRCKKRTEPGTPGDPRDEGVPRRRRGGCRLPRSADDHPHLSGGLADAEDRKEGQVRAGRPQGVRQADERGCHHENHHHENSMTSPLAHSQNFCDNTSRRRATPESSAGGEVSAVGGERSPPSFYPSYGHGNDKGNQRLH